MFSLSERWNSTGSCGTMATWARSDAGGYRSGVAWVSDRAVVAVGSHGASWSVDGGRTFSPFGSEPFHSVARAPDGSVWACGAGG